MAKLYLKFGDKVLKEITLSSGVVSIGRLPDNLVHVDNPAVSGHHARVHWENDRYMVEDLASTNGTYLNGQPVQKADLKDGDVVRVGKHSLEHRERPNEEGSGARKVVDRAAHWQKEFDEKPLVNLDPTALMDRDRAKELIASGGQSQRRAGSANPGQQRVGVLRVIEGKADAQQYTLTGKLTIIGKSSMATIRLKSWLAPDTAAIVERREDAYFVAPAGKGVDLRVNDEAISEPRELQEGDTLHIADLKMTFSYLMPAG